MATKLEIINRALAKLGEDRIADVDDDVKAAREMSALYDIVLLAELREHNWNFAVARASLDADATAPEWGYQYRYELPADFVKLLDIDGAWRSVSSSDRITYDSSLFRIEAGFIVTDMAEPLLIRYTRSLEADEEPLMDKAFVESFACRLAVEGCEILTQSSTKRQLAMQEYQRSIVAAIMANAVENPPTPIADDSWMLARL